MNITVIGHLCLDTIRGAGAKSPRSDENTTQSYGGIFFAVAALANIAAPGTVIHPVFGVGKNEYVELLNRLGRYTNVNCDGIYKFDGQTNEVFLSYGETGQRTECSKHIAEAISFKRIKPYLDTDIVLINMISGYDITLETLDEIRMHVRDARVPIYFDVHSLSLGIGENFIRYRRPLTDWRRWLFWLHAVQMNLEEANGLSTEKFPEPDFAKQVTALNTKALIITKGEAGCTAYTDEHKHVTRHNYPGNTVERAVDGTGCGDVFGAAYCAKYVESKDILQSAEFANTVAARKAGLRGSHGIDELERFRLSAITEQVAETKQ